ncbi:MAG: tetratricopeptide repeat protein, partial [Candidatus Zixiibacteriota bacterium]
MYPDLRFTKVTTPDQIKGYFVWGYERDELFDAIEEAIELENIEKMENTAYDIIDKDPDLIMAYNIIGSIEENKFNYGKAFEAFEIGYRIGKARIPDDFEGTIGWEYIENRSFLTAMHNYGCVYNKIHIWQEATDIFEKLIEFNPNDNTGARMELIESYLALGKYESIIELCDKYTDDASPEIMYGKILAHYRLGNKKEAEKALKDALEFAQNIAEEIIKDEHSPYLNDEPFVVVGSKKQAEMYWDQFGHFWVDPALI